MRTYFSFSSPESSRFLSSLPIIRRRKVHNRRTRIPFRRLLPKIPRFELGAQCQMARVTVGDCP